MPIEEVGLDGAPGMYMSEIYWISGACDKSNAGVSRIGHAFGMDSKGVLLGGGCAADDEIGAVANYVTSRFGSKPSQVRAQPRKQASQ
jgi:hypothetical protein